MNKLEVMMVIALFLLALMGGFMIGENRNSCVLPLSPQEDITAEKVDMAYNIETNQTYWKYPNETEWKLIE